LVSAAFEGILTIVADGVSDDGSGDDTADETGDVSEAVT
jgi:hypothetical protein